MIIIPTSSPIVLKSTASIACSWSSVCVSRISVAPSSATFVRSTRSEAIDRERGDEQDHGEGHVSGLPPGSTK